VTAEQIAGRPGGGHYTIWRFDSIDDVRAQFPDDVDYTLNWLFVGTSGVHGSYAALDDVMDALTTPPDPSDDDEDGDDPPTVTLLIVQPRLVKTMYGDVPVTPADIAWLRTVVAGTTEGIEESQGGSR
jgi:hypothetical protein